MILRHRFMVAALAATSLLATTSQAQTVQMYSEINGAQAGTASAGTGSASITVDTAANTLTYSISFSGLSGTESVSHFHAAAMPGMGAGVVEPLPLGSPKVGVWNYPDAQEANILGGLVYINIHSSVNGGGEIRGQVCIEPVNYCTCSSTQVAPCMNFDDAAGCQNSTGSGSHLSFSGLPSVILDTLIITANTPQSNGIFYMGQNQSRLPFGDGLRCVGGSTFRYPIQTAVGGVMTLGPGTAAFSAANFGGFGGAISAGQSWNFQAWFRDNTGPCATAFNLSDGLSVSWTP